MLVLLRAQLRERLSARTCESTLAQGIVEGNSSLIDSIPIRLVGCKKLSWRCRIHGTVEDSSHYLFATNAERVKPLKAYYIIAAHKVNRHPPASGAFAPPHCVSRIPGSRGSFPTDECPIQEHGAGARRCVGYLVPGYLGPARAK